MKNTKYNFYPELDDIDFYKKIFMKKEFHKFSHQQQNTLSNDFQLLPQQEFLKNYISLNTPYNSVLVFHGTGVGKTCTAITIAEGFKKTLKSRNTKITVLLSRNIKENFIKELYNIKKPDHKQCVGTRYKYGEEFAYAPKEKKEYKIRKKIKEYYKFFGYKEFANYVMKLCEWDGILKNLTTTSKSLIAKYYRNRIFIIDEVHHIKSIATDNLTKKVPPILEAIVTYGKNIKLIMMSATPMYDSPKEIIFLLNLMLLNDNREKINEHKIFNVDGELTNDGRDILIDKSRGYVSYFRGGDIKDFPYRIYAPESITPSFKYNIKGDPKDVTIKYLKIFPCWFSSVQYKFYQTTIKKNINTNFKSTTINITQQISNIIFPMQNGQFTYGKHGFQKTDNGKGAFYKVEKIIQKKKKIYFKYQTHVISNLGKKNETPFLSLGRLGEYSTKIEAIIKNIIASRGLVYIYSEFIESGTLPIALALEQAGYERYVLSNENQLLDYSKNKVGGGGKHPPRCYHCGKTIHSEEHKEGHKNYHQFKIAKYVLIAGDFADNRLIINKYINLFKDENNKDGQFIKILIGTRVTGEGTDLRGIRQIHITEPWWNISRLEQIIGRGIRHKSHQYLPPDQRNVELFQYATMPPKNSSKKDKETETVDVYTYAQAEKKDIRIKEIEFLLKRTAIDCVFFKYNNIRPNKKIVKQISSRDKKIDIRTGNMPDTRDCNYMKKCSFDCIWEPSKNNKNIQKGIINDNTYKLNFYSSEIEKIKKYIKNLFKIGIIYNLREIETFIHKFINVDNTYIYYALDIMINNKVTITDKFKRKGYILYRGDYYIFQPLNIKDEKLPLYYRDIPIKIRRKYIKLLNEEVNINNTDKININDILKSIEDKSNSKLKSLINRLIIKNDSNVKEIIIRMTIDEYPSEIIRILYKYHLEHKNYYLNIYFRNLSSKTIKNGMIIKDDELEYKNYNGKDTGNIIGIIIKSNKDSKFRFIDKEKNREDQTISKKRSKRSLLSGRVCLTYDSYYLQDIYKKINYKILKKLDSKIKKNYYCFLIEFMLRYLNLIKYKNKEWIIYKKI